MVSGGQNRQTRRRFLASVQELINFPKFVRTKSGLPTIRQGCTASPSLIKMFFWSVGHSAYEQVRRRAGTPASKDSRDNEKKVKLAPIGATLGLPEGVDARAKIRHNPKEYHRLFNLLNGNREAQSPKINAVVCQLRRRHRENFSKNRPLWKLGSLI